MSDSRQNEYISPFSSRYASPQVSYLFSNHYRTLLFRKLWISLASAQKKMGLPITSAQISAMKKGAPTIDFSVIHAYEKKFKHDVMAHIHAFGDLCPEAKPIIHLGATSTYVTDNGDLIQMREALQVLFTKLLHVLKLLSIFAKKYAKNPCLGFTHYQSAQPTTIGKRATLWLQDLLLDAKEWERLFLEMPFLGVKGATGTQSSFLSLLNHDSKKVTKLEQLIAADFGFKKVIAVSGQTYTRKLDLFILNAFESFASSAHKIATDIRLLAHDGELFEGFEKTQVGSSAMPYKRNPIYSERICGISRFVISLSQNGAYTNATQWLERSLDDSSNKRLSIPEAFLGVDAILNLLIHLFSSLTPSTETALKRLIQEIPFLAMENILMSAVKKGGDRQKLHEKLRQNAFLAKNEKDPSEYLIQKILSAKDFQLTRKELEPLFSIRSLIGSAEEQTDYFLQEEVAPYLKNKLKKIEIHPIDV